MMEDLKDLSKLNNKSTGYYIFPITYKTAYEIFIEYWDINTPIESAKASLCIIYESINNDNSTSIEREWLSIGDSITKLLEIAYLDNKSKYIC